MPVTDRRRTESEKQVIQVVRLFQMVQVVQVVQLTNQLVC